MTDESDRQILIEFLDEVGRAVERAAAQLRSPDPAGVATAQATAFDATVAVHMSGSIRPTGSLTLRVIPSVDPTLVQRVISIVGAGAAVYGMAVVDAAAEASLEQLLDLAKVVLHHLG